MPAGTLRICDQGHRFYKTSDCPTCPLCEEERKPADGFLSALAAPARRALGREGLKSLSEIAMWTESDMAALHGMGPSTIKKLRELLKQSGLGFKS